MSFSDSITKENSRLTFTEEKAVNLFLSKLDKLVTRDEIAKALWGSQWLEKYSEYMIDKTVYRLRKKILDTYQVITLKKRGYILTKKSQRINLTDILPIVRPQGVFPHTQYIEYMNDPKNIRKTLTDLFNSMKKEKINNFLYDLLEKPDGLSILIINSYSHDNVDSVVNWLSTRGKKDKAVFSHFDDRALKIHQKRVFDLKSEHIEVIYDDIRQTRMTTNTFDLVINDFRLNFNSSNDQNVKTMKNTRRILKENGFALVSIVVDARYESSRYGKDQEKAPINKNAPFTFRFKENLDRFCQTVPYYKSLFEKNGFKIVKEFDVSEGKTWFSKEKFIPNHEPTYRRFLLKKI